jgi:hypothetical protein
MTTLKDKEMYTNGGIFHLQGNYFESKDVKEAVLKYRKEYIEQGFVSIEAYDLIFGDFEK